MYGNLGGSFPDWFLGKGKGGGGGGGGGGYSGMGSLGYGSDYRPWWENP